MGILSEQTRIERFESQRARVRELVLKEGMDATCSGYPCPHILGAYKKIAELETELKDRTGKLPEVDNENTAKLSNE